MIFRVYVEKKPGFDVAARRIAGELQEQLGVSPAVRLRILQRYDVERITADEFATVCAAILSEPPQDYIYDECPAAEWALTVEPQPGQYDQQADSAAQCIQLYTQGEPPLVKCGRVYLFDGALLPEQKAAVKKYLINPLESREAAIAQPQTLLETADEPADVREIAGFITATDDELLSVKKEYGYVMSAVDLQFCRDWFRDGERRNPTVTELKLIDTYWSDHCRHTTFNTSLTEIITDESSDCHPLRETLERWRRIRAELYGADSDRPETLMDLACIGAKKIRRDGGLDDLEISDENNACSVVVNACCADGDIETLLMFKNETHNHPTEIEPYGGAATCLGGAIRDPLSGRAYVFGSLRVSGAADPRQSLAQTLEGKLPQRVITTGAAAGFSAYGNQIGLATGKVAEYYHPGYAAKRMEVGAVVAAVRRDAVTRQQPDAGDVIVLLGGDTGRDGIGGATGSSVAHDADSLEKCGAEVQKGNPPTERKIQRLFRDTTVSRMIKKCNDFGAGGVAVAIGELADSLDIDLSLVPKKYEGLDGTELAVSESQERMAVLLRAEDQAAFIAAAAAENLKATAVARVTDTGRLVMRWRGKVIVDISREFLDTNGAPQAARVQAGGMPGNIDRLIKKDFTTDCLRQALSGLGGCSQKGLVERFDSSIGSATVLLPFGGERQLTPSEGLAMLLPVGRECRTAALMAHGFDPELADASPYHAAVYAVVQAVARLVAMGGDYRKARLSLQEYFERLERDPLKWGKPLAALLGALEAQLELGTPAIGGKDSMSGTFKDISVPPTLIAFAVATADAGTVIGNEFRSPGNNVYLLKTHRYANGLPDWSSLRANFDQVAGLIADKKVMAANSVKGNGVLHAVAEMAAGNETGLVLEGDAAAICADGYYGDFLLEAAQPLTAENLHYIGRTVAGVITVGSETISLKECRELQTGVLEKVFPTVSQTVATQRGGVEISRHAGGMINGAAVKAAKPRVFMPVFPGTNCEYDSAAAFERAGASVETMVFRNLTPAAVEQSIAAMAAKLQQAQILMLPGGFSAADEPEGSGKFIATVLRNERIRTQIEALLERDGLILGICNGFQALVKSGLLPYGKIAAQSADAPTLTFNNIGRHVSTVVQTVVTSGMSPWLALADRDTIYKVPVSHGEGRFVCTPQQFRELQRAGQIATCYAGAAGEPTMLEPFNPNGSAYAIEGITSSDGRIFGKMGHSERIGKYLYKNLPGEYDMKIFEAGVKWFR